MSMRIDYKESLVNEVKRILGKLAINDPSCAGYKAMVEVLVKLDEIINGIEYDELDSVRQYIKSENKRSLEEMYTQAIKAKYGKTYTASSQDTPANDEPEVVTATSTFPTDEPVSESVGEPERITVVEEPELPKEEKLTKESVRALLKEAAEAGVMVQPIMAKFIPEGKKQTFSSVKAADYPALVEELNNARTAQ